MHTRHMPDLELALETCKMEILRQGGLTPQCDSKLRGTPRGQDSFVVVLN